MVIPEEWRQITGYKYYVSNEGEIRNKNGIHLKTRYSKNGYELVNLCLNGKQKTFYVHRIVAQEFIENPENKTDVDHINRNKKDNRVENLRWCTKNENMINIGFYKNNKLHEKNISKCSGTGKYVFNIMRNNKIIKKFFNSLDEAIEFRDNIYNQSLS